MGNALRADDCWSQDADLLIDDQYRHASVRAPLRPTRREVDFEIAGVTVRFDVSLCDGEIPDAVCVSLERLAELADRKDGWDSHGSARLDLRTIRPAIELIVDGFGPCLHPDISLTSTGGLNLAWTCGGRELEIELLPDGRCDYAFEDGANGEELAPDEPVPFEEARKLLAKLH